MTTRNEQERGANGAASPETRRAVQAALNAPVFPASPKYPQVHVRLSGTDGNAFAILAAVGKAMRLAGLSAAQREEFMADATSGDYDKLLQSAMRWVDVS